ncbi:MAG: right-handed parallel beta-helix repeat-containing protein, partial [Nanoarchaeota archaeon]|nr:right-handed parallel beta-helix repeat-containing protein [Nanoarchaeota archaeon]
MRHNKRQDVQERLRRLEEYRENARTYHNKIITLSNERELDDGDFWHYHKDLFKGQNEKEFFEKINQDIHKTRSELTTLKNQTLVRGPVLFLIIGMFVMGLFWTVQYGPTGFIIGGEQREYNIPLNMEIDQSQIMPLSFDDLYSFKVSGTVQGPGSVRMYLIQQGEDDVKRILVLDSNNLENSESIGKEVEKVIEQSITGFVVFEDNISEDNQSQNTTDIPIENTTIFPENISVEINLSDEYNESYNESEDAASNLTVNLSINTYINTTDASTNITQVVINTSANTSGEDVGVEGIFSDVCIDSCRLSGISTTSIEIEIEGDMVLVLESIAYSSASKNRPPVQLQDIEDFWMIDEYVLDSLDYFSDFDEDNLTFRIKENPYVRLRQENHDIVFYSTGIQGTYELFLYVSDGVEEIESNLFNVSVYNETPTQQRNLSENISTIRIGEPVLWQKHIKVQNRLAESIIKEVRFNAFANISNLSIRTGNSTINKTLTIPEKGEEEIEYGFDYEFDPESSEDFFVSFYTPGPEITETQLAHKKRVTISASVHYENIPVVVEILPALKDSIRLLWLRESGKQQFPIERYIDSDFDGLIDKIEWIVPHLSNQTFDIEIRILNVQSYPVVGGNWTVRFETVGEADLRISAVNGTNWSNSLDTRDLLFLELRCGQENLSFDWVNQSVFVSNYSCGDMGYEISKVLTSGSHHLMFEFGDQVGYAHNFAYNRSMNSVTAYEKLGMPAHPHDGAISTGADNTSINVSDNDRWNTSLASSADELDGQIFIFNTTTTHYPDLSFTWEGYGMEVATYLTNISFFNYTSESWNEVYTTDFTSVTEAVHTVIVNNNTYDFINSTSREVAVLVQTRLAGGSSTVRQNAATGNDCDTHCAGFGETCTDIGTDAGGTNDKYWTDPGLGCAELSGYDCTAVMIDQRKVCGGPTARWTYCLCAASPWDRGLNTDYVELNADDCNVTSGAFNVSSSLQCYADNMRVTNLTISDGGLLIINGTNLTVDGDVLIQPGGALRIEDSKGSIWYNGNVTVKGSMNITNSTIHMNGTCDGCVVLNVTSTGQMQINESSNITNGDSDSSEYLFHVQTGAQFEMFDSNIEETGFSEDSVCSQGFCLQAHNANITNSTFFENFVHINVYNANNTRLHNITIGDSDLGIGMYVWSSNNTYINHSYLHDAGGASTLYEVYSVNMTVTLSNIIGDQFAVFLEGSDYNTITLSNLTSGLTGISYTLDIYASNGNYIDKVNLTGTDGGAGPSALLFTNGAHSNVINNSWIESTLSNAISSQTWATNNTVENCVLRNHTDAGDYAIRISQSNITLINTTYDHTITLFLTAPHMITYINLLKVVVNETRSGDMVEGANVTIYNASYVEYVNSDLTDSDGATKWFPVVSWNHTEDGTFGYYNNYSINVSASGYDNNSVSINVTSRTVYNISIADRCKFLGEGYLMTSDLYCHNVSGNASTFGTNSGVQFTCENCSLNITGKVTVGKNSLMDFVNCTFGTGLVLGGNISIEGGTLNVTRSDLHFNGSCDGCSGINSTSDSTLILNQSNISTGADNTKNYFIIVPPTAASFNLENSYVEYAGWDEPANDYGIKAGIFINKNWTFIKNTTFQNNFWGIYYWSAFESNLSNVTVINYRDASAGVGIGFYGNSQLNNISNVYVEATDYGLMLDRSHNNTIENSDINTVDLGGTYLTYASENTFRNVDVESTGAAEGDYAIYFLYGTNNTFYDSKFTHDDGVPGQTGYGNITFIDCEFNKAAESNSFNLITIGPFMDVVFVNCSLDYEAVVSTAASMATFIEYFNVLVEDSNDNPISGANVSIYNGSQDLINWSLTNASGYSPWLNITTRIKVGIGVQDHNNHTIIVNKTNYLQSNHSHNVTVLPETFNITIGNYCEPWGRDWYVDQNTNCSYMNIKSSNTTLKASKHLYLDHVNWTADANVTLWASSELDIVNCSGPNQIWFNDNITSYAFINITNSTIRMNSSCDNCTSITQHDGLIKINDSSNITNGADPHKKFDFIFDSSSPTFIMDSSTIQHLIQGLRFAIVGLPAETADYIRIRNSKILNSRYYGVFVKTTNVQDINISHNEINVSAPSGGEGYGIYLRPENPWSPFPVYVVNNTITMNATMEHGIYITHYNESNVSLNTIIFNSSSPAGWGIEILNSGRSLVENNSIQQQPGNSMPYRGMLIYNSSNVTLNDNYIHATYVGLSLSFANWSTVNNLTARSATGTEGAAYNNGSSNVVYHNCTFISDLNDAVVVNMSNNVQYLDSTFDDGGGADDYDIQ